MTPSIEERQGLGEASRRVIAASVRYYRGWGQLAAGWAAEVVSAGRDAGLTVRLPDIRLPPLRLPQFRLPEVHGSIPASPPPASGNGAGAAATDRAAPAMLLEGMAGHEALGVFLVENGLSHPVDAPVVATPMTDPQGRVLDASLRFDPHPLQLGPGEQILVRVAATIPDEAEADVGYRGELTVPGLPGTRVAVVLRRRPGDRDAMPITD